MSDEHEAEYGLMMPFVTVASVGGPHDDESFVAGYAAGQIDAKLATAAAVGANHLVEVAYTSLHGQLDLIAMQHGYTIDPVEDGEWTTYSFLSDVARSLLNPEDD